MLPIMIINWSKSVSSGNQPRTAFLCSMLRGCVLAEKRFVEQPLHSVVAHQRICHRHERILEAGHLSQSNETQAWGGVAQRSTVESLLQSLTYLKL